MKKEDTLEVLKKMLLKHKIINKKTKNNEILATNLSKNINVDSLKLLNLITDLENKFNKKIFNFILRDKKNYILKNIEKFLSKKN
jgi:acyl carrier protein